MLFPITLKLSRRSSSLKKPWNHENFQLHFLKEKIKLVPITLKWNGTSFDLKTLQILCQMHPTL